MNWFKTKYRLAAFSVMMLLLFIHMSSSTGVALAMLSGMENCTQMLDIQPTQEPELEKDLYEEERNSHCFSHQTRAALLGAYFYGHLAQFVFISLAHKMGYTPVTRVIICLCGALQLIFPICLEVSAYLNIAMQGFRGAIAGVIVPSIMEFSRRWGLDETEIKKFISATGIVIILGASFGPTIAGFVGTRLGWEYYFYLSGASYLVLLVVMVLFIPESPLDAFLMSVQELDAFIMKNDTTSLNSGSEQQSQESLIDDEPRLDNECMTDDSDHSNDMREGIENDAGFKPHQKERQFMENLRSGSHEELKENTNKNEHEDIPKICASNSCSDDEQLGDKKRGIEINKETGRATFKDIFSRTYVYAFSVYAFCSSFTYYTSIMTAPFYLREVMGTSLDLISLWTAIMGITGAVGTLAFSLIFLKVDKLMSWLKCRMLFCLLPPFVISIGNLIVPSFDSSAGALVVLLLDSLARSTAFSGSIYTINYELDPLNAPVILGVFNTFGQISGFLNPLTMIELTGTLDKEAPDYPKLIRSRWDTFFYINAAVEFGAVLAIIMSVSFRRKEWKKHCGESEISTSSVAVKKEHNGKYYVNIKKRNFMD